MPLKPGLTLVPKRNLIANPEFLIAQRGVGPFTAASVPVNNDDTYLLDQWILLAEGADSVDVSQVATGLPTVALAGARAKIRLDIETANLKFGILHILEAAEAREIIGGVASLSFKAQFAGGTSISSCRAAILAWSSTADTVTSDVVSTWDASDAGVTLVANWTLEGSVTFTPTTSWVEYKLENVAIDTASAANVAVMIWADDTTATTVGEFLEITDVNLVGGSVATPILRRSQTDDDVWCRRHLRVYGGGDTAEGISNAQAFSTTLAAGLVMLDPPMRVAPTLSLSAITDFCVTGSTGAGIECTDLTIAATTVRSVALVGTVAAGLTAGNACRIRADSTASARLYLSSEL